MYALTEYAVVVLIVVGIGVFSFLAVSTVLIVVEGLNSIYRGLRARQAVRDAGMDGSRAGLTVAPVTP